MTVEKAKNVYKNSKKNAKTEERENRLKSKQTGVGPPPPPLSKETQLMMRITPKDFKLAPQNQFDSDFTKEDSEEASSMKKR